MEIPSSSNQVDPSEYNVLILGPGGNKGLSEIGALEYCSITNRLRNLQVIGGVSVGAIIGLLLTCGYTVSDILTQALSTSLLDEKNLLNYTEILNQQGIFSQKSYKEKLERIIKDKLTFIPTLDQLYHATGKEFMAVTTNVKIDKDNYIQRPEFFTYKTQPYLSSVEAALMSSNIPGLFSKIEYNGGIYVDGALSNPYPVDQYDFPGNKILGISVIGVPSSGGRKIIDYAVQSINAPMAQLRYRIQQASSKRVSHLDIPVTIESSGLIVSKEEKKGMFMEGFLAAKKFFDQTGKNVKYLEETQSAVFDE